MRQHSFLQLSCFLLAWSSTFSTTWAQIYAPTPVFNMAFTSRIDEALFIFGGTSQNNPAATNVQFFSLDLTVPRWDTSSPPWRYLAVPETFQAGWILGMNTMVMSPDESQVLVIDGRRPYLSTYNISSNAWLEQRTLPPSFSYGYNFTTVIDPGSNVMYLGRGGSNGTMMMVYNVTTGYSWTQPMPDASLLSPYVQGYSFVYCASRKSILLFGGKSNDLQGYVYNSFVYEFQMTAYKWIRLNTEGPSPTQIFDHCMVPAYEGFKMIVFGGSTTNNVQLDDIYILDIPTMTWTKGQPPPTPLNRSSMACTVSGDNFIAWGGYNSQKAVDGTPIIYNIRTNRWTTSYSLTSEQPKYNLGGLIGGIIAAAIIAAVIIFVYLRHKRRRNAKAKSTNNDTPSLTSFSQQQQQHLQLQRLKGAYHQRVLDRESSSVSVQGLISKENNYQSDHVSTNYISPSMAYVTPHIRNNNSIRLSLNSTTSFNQPPQQDQVELYEKGYYVPESTLRNPQYCIDDVGNLAGDTVEPLSGSIWMTPRRNPQDLSQHHLLVRSGSNMEITTKPGEESESGNRFDPTLCKGSTYDQPMYHEAQSEYSNVRVGDK